MKILITGAGGFLGWHLRCRLHALHGHEVFAVDRSTMADLDRLMIGADAVIHVAGVNRAPDEEVFTGNIDLAEMVGAAALLWPRLPRPPSRPSGYFP